MTRLFLTNAIVGLKSEMPPGDNPQGGAETPASGTYLAIDTGEWYQSTGQGWQLMGTVHDDADFDTLAALNDVSLSETPAGKFLVNTDGAWEDAALPIATTEAPGISKPDGSSVAVDEDGTIHSAQPSIATTEAVGLSKPDGSSLTIDEDGTMHVVDDDSDDDSAYLTTDLLESDSTDITPGHIVTADDTRLSDHRHPTIGFAPLTDGDLADTKLIFVNGDCIMVPFAA